MPVRFIDCTFVGLLLPTFGELYTDSAQTARQVHAAKKSFSHEPMLYTAVSIKHGTVEKSFFVRMPAAYKKRHPRLRRNPYLPPPLRKKPLSPTKWKNRIRFVGVVVGLRSVNRRKNALHFLEAQSKLPQPVIVLAALLAEAAFRE